MKKTLALVLAFALVFSTMTVAFAEDAAAIGADAKVCSDLGMLKGATGTVDAAYLATVPNRLQAAVMFLRLKGLEAEANAFAGTENFADANKVNWGKPVMAYLKAHPELGWVGDGTNFDPASAMTAQQYYKVMLEALGYKQNTATVVGDFTWENVITFAATKGLTKNAAVANFTVNDLAVATVEALKANVKDTTKTLVATLVEAGKIDKAAATTAGVYTEAAATSTAKLDSVRAIGNDKVEVTFDSNVDKAYAENVANYKVIVKGSTTALEVKSAVLAAPTIVTLTTAAQTVATAYTLTVADVAKNFNGLSKSTSALEVDTVRCIDTNTLEVVYKSVVDRASAEDVANYTVNNGATVKKAEVWVDQDDSRKTVKLTTEGVANNKVYKLKIANVKSADLVAIKTVEKSFSGITDTKAPTINGNIIVKNNQRILVNFTDTHGVDKATAEDLANYSIEGLKIESVKAVDYDGDDYAYWDQVEIFTEPMEASKKYTLSISNLADGSSSHNVIAKVLTKSYSALTVDKTAPKAGQITVYGDSMIEVAFQETNRLDVASATDINNYTFNEGLKVLSAKILRSSKPDTDLGKTVVLTTSTMDKDTTYKVTIENVADEFGNVMAKVSNRSIARSTGSDIKPPAVLRTDWLSLDQVKLTFDERVDADAANDAANYAISGDLSVLKAEVSGGNGYKTVTLTTTKQTENKAYTITINGVKDRLGNVMSGYKAYFVSQVDGVDTTRPEIDNISVLNKNEIRVTFSEMVFGTPGAPNMKVDSDGDGYNALDANDFTATIVGLAPNYTMDDETTVVFKTNKTIPNTNEFTITDLTGVIDQHYNSFVVDASDLPTFYGNTTTADVVKVSTKDQTDGVTLVFTFDQPILTTGATITSSDASATTFNAYVDKEDDRTTDALSTLTLVAPSVMPLDRKYKFNLSGFVTDYCANAIADEDTDGYTYYTVALKDDDKPTVDYVESVSTKQINVVFSEDMSAYGTYQIKDSDGDVVATTLTPSRDADYHNIIKLAVGTPLVAGDVYKLIPKTAAKDISNNSLDIKDLSFEFVASAVVQNDYIKGVKIIDGKTLEIRLTKAMDTTAADALTVSATDTITNMVDTNLNVPNVDSTLQVDNGITGNGTSVLTVFLSTPVLDGVNYTITTTGAVADTYTFDGAVSDGGVEVDANEVVTFSGFNGSDFVVLVVYEGETQQVVWDNAGVGTGFDATTALDAMATGAGVPTDATYTVEVYRVDSTGTADSAIYYSKEFTRE